MSYLYQDERNEADTVAMQARHPAVGDQTNDRICVYMR